MNLSRQKDKEIYAVLEQIRSHPKDMAVVFAQEGHLELKEKTFPQIFSKIQRWSSRYKMVQEKLDHPSDTEAYLSDISKRLLKASMVSIEMLANLYRVYLEDNMIKSATIEEIGAADLDLYLLFRSYARLLAVEARGYNFQKLSGSKKAAVLLEINDEEIDLNLSGALKKVSILLVEQEKIRRVAREILGEYPNLKQVLAISKMQLTLREDGHHLIVPHQRKLARLMLELAEKFVPAVFGRPEEIFDISTDEIIALLHEENPGYIVRSLERWKILKDAELRLNRGWSINKKTVFSITKDADILWEELKNQGYIYGDGTLKEKARRLRKTEEVVVSFQFEEQKEAIFTVLVDPIKNIILAIRQFQTATEQACVILDEQIVATTLPRLKEAYRAEQKRLRSRIERLFELADQQMVKVDI